MKNRRIYLAPIGGTRRTTRHWLELSPFITGDIYVRSLRRIYRQLRRGGMNSISARFALYDIVALGVSSKRCDNYGGDR
jgi:hypothetical protein